MNIVYRIYFSAFFTNSASDNLKKFYIFIDIVANRKSKVKKNMKYFCFYWANSVLHDEKLQKV